MLGLNNFFFRNGRLLFVFRLFRGLLRRRLRRLLCETETCPKEERDGETQKTTRILHRRQRSFLHPQETGIRDVRHRMRERGHRQSVRGGARGASSPANLIATREIAVRMRPQRKLVPQGALHATCWSVRRHSTTSRCCVGLAARPERGTTKERRSPAPEDPRGIAKGNEGRARQRARTRSRGGPGRKRAASLVRRNRQGGS